MRRLYTHSNRLGIERWHLNFYADSRCFEIGFAVWRDQLGTSQVTISFGYCGLLFSFF